MARHRSAVSSGALLVYLFTAGTAALNGQGHEPERKAPPAAAKPASAKAPDMSTVVERIQKRIDDEVGKPAAPRAAAAPKKPVRRADDRNTAAAPDRRIRLLWRVSLIWPAELVEER